MKFYHSMKRKNYAEYEHIEEYRKNTSKLKIFRGDLLYQYRNLSDFWSIIKSDSFWATNARFSNDNKEQEIGMQIAIKNLTDNLKDKEDVKSAIKKLSVNDCYILCFCEESDLLSQWRGYANNGVSIGFRFRCVMPFSIESKINNRVNYKVMYEAATAVDYRVTKDEDFEVLNLDPKKPNDFVKNVNKYIPYIKHFKFNEEKEYRIVFQNENHELNDYIYYRQANNLMIPYIIVKQGIQEKEGNPIIRIPFFNDLPDDKQTKIHAFVKKNHYILTYPNSKDNYSDKECRGCNIYYTTNYENQDPDRIECPYHSDINTNRRSIKKDITNYNQNNNLFNEIYISANKNVEEKVFNSLEQLIRENDLENVKIWCEGHLPIRTITVGPIRNPKEVKESIIHYCKSIYWLRYVEVMLSDIPYRRSLD